jgi:hypothetical protein
MIVLPCMKSQGEERVMAMNICAFFELSVPDRFWRFLLCTDLVKIGGHFFDAVEMRQVTRGGDLEKWPFHDSHLADGEGCPTVRPRLVEFFRNCFFSSKICSELRL